MPRQPIPQKKSEDGWNIIQAGINDILQRKQSQLKLTNLYEAVGNLVNANSDILRTGLQNILTEHFKKWREELSLIAGNPLIARFSVVYDDYRTYCSIIPKIYSLYDRRNNKTQDNETLNLIQSLFQTLVLRNSTDTLMKGTTDGIRNEIRIARSQNNADLKNISNLIKMYYEFRKKLNIFDAFFEAFETDTINFYDAFFKAKYEGSSFPNYLQTASEQFAREESIMKEIFQKDERIEILTACLFNLLTKNEPKFLQGDEPPVSIALTNQDKRPLKWLIDTYQNFGLDLERIYTACSIYIMNQMLQLSVNFKENMKAGEISTNISELIQLTEDFSRPYHLIFDGLQKAKEKLEECIKKAWNDRRFNIEENFCVYIDTQFKGDFKNMKAEEREQFPSIVAKFYNLLEDKKTFVVTYEHNMVRRFIKMGLKLVDIETPTINAIRRAKAADFAKSFKDYVKTIQDSENLETQFKEELHNTKLGQGVGKIGFQPIVFDQKRYPLEKNVATILPQPVQPINQAFCDFYTKKHPNYVLQLLQDVSTIESKFHVPKNSKTQQSRTYTVSSDILCATIVHAVSEKPMKYPELQSLISDQRMLDLNLKRLISKSCQILKVESKEKKKSDNVFSLNPNFFSKSSRVLIPPVINERKKDMSTISENVNNEKSENIQAAIVRVLKKNNRIEQGQLENDVINELAPYFRADVGIIRRILGQLETEYFNRIQEKDSVILEYVK